jgi:hypothetical protein
MSIGTLLGHLDEMHAVAGLMVGLLVGLTGVGGGSLMTPLLVLMFGVNPRRRWAPTCCSRRAPRRWAPPCMVSARR